MPTSEQLQRAKAQEQELKRHGVSIDLRFDPAPRAFWYRVSDGTQVGPSKLPADPYHTERYMKRGLTMVPPREKITIKYLQPEKSLSDLIDELDNKEEPRMPTQQEMRPGGRIDGHYHKFTQKMKSPCQRQPCDAVRTSPYIPRPNRRRNKEIVTAE
jgi:hypothetical protein